MIQAEIQSLEIHILVVHVRFVHIKRCNIFSQLAELALLLVDL